MAEVQLKLSKTTDKHIEKDLNEEIRILDLKYRLATLKAVRMEDLAI